MESLLDRSSADSGFAKNQWFISVPSMWINCDFGPDTWELPLLTDLDIFGCVISKPVEAKNKNPTEQSGTFFDFTIYKRFLSREYHYFGTKNKCWTGYGPFPICSAFGID